MGHGVEEHIKNIQAFVHPGTNLRRSLAQHARHFDGMKGPMLVLLMIGTNDVASGARPQTIVDQMLALIRRIQNGHDVQDLYFAVCAVLPRPVDELYTKAGVKECNVLLKRHFGEMDNVVFLRTHSVFLSKRKITRDLYGRDGLHLSFGGKQWLFLFIKIKVSVAFLSP